LVSPAKVIGLDGPEAVCPPLDVTVKYVMELPPFDVGAVKLIVAWALPAVAVPIVGAPGAAAGVTGLEAPDGREFPAAFAAVTVNV
jgi:hypothetical protein